MVSAVVDESRPPKGSIAPQQPLASVAKAAVGAFHPQSSGWKWGRTTMLPMPEVNKAERRIQQGTAVFLQTSIPPVQLVSPTAESG